MRALLSFVGGLILLLAIIVVALFVGQIIWNATHSEAIAVLGFMGTFVGIIIGAGQIRL